ncbi:MAG: hypothetical protein LBT39_05605, partial [Treponema sp.]|nr:hypothetical protein [Treponema sp.]
MPKQLRNNIFAIIRAALFVSILVNAGIVAFRLFSRGSTSVPDVLDQCSENIESVFLAIVTFALSFGSTIIERRQKIDIPDALEIAIVIFIYVGMFLSTQLNLYYALP